MVAHTLKSLATTALETVHNVFEVKETTREWYRRKSDTWLQNILLQKSKMYRKASTEKQLRDVFITTSLFLLLG